MGISRGARYCGYERVISNQFSVISKKIEEIMQDFKKLKVWEKSHQLTLAIYQVTSSFPKEEMYGLTSQMRRAASSIPTNIAEGSGRGGKAELARFLQIAIGSASEIEYQILLAQDLNFLQASDYASLAASVDEIKRMLTGFIQKLKTDN
jgi:four helix bundle protein